MRISAILAAIIAAFLTLQIYPVKGAGVGVDSPMHDRVLESVQAQKTVLAAVWRTPDYLILARAAQHGPSQGGFAESMCYEIADTGYIGPPVIVEIIDADVLVLTGESRHLGLAKCNYHTRR